MASKQNRTLLAIDERQDRAPLGLSEMLRARHELDMLNHYLARAGESSDELRKFVPVRVVACIEGCLKAATAELINHGEPYRSNARQLFHQVKIDFDVLKALLEERVSFGEVIANSVGYHDIAEINARMTTLLGFKFFDALRSVEDRRDIEILKLPAKPIVDSLDGVLADIEAALKLRHVICHEATLARVSEVDAERFLKAGLQLTNAIAWLILETLYPNGPLTQTDMNIDAGRRAAAAEDELGAGIQELLEKLDDEDKALLRASQESWVAYRNAFSRLEANAAKGGTLSSSIFGSTSESMAKSRIQEIRECLRQEGLEGTPKRRRRLR